MGFEINYKILRRLYSSSIKLKKPVLLTKKSILAKKPTTDKQPKSPARTRFAPSPTGLLHIGSLRTALYNYLLAKSTGGEFLLRLEDTDQKRLVPGAEESIYESLKWCGLSFDEGPGVNDAEFGPFRQSDRTKIYQSYINKLLDLGVAYRCFCPKERLDNLRDSAQKLQPPTTVSYDRHCAHHSTEKIQEQLDQKIPFTVRLKSPQKYPPFEDLLHGSIDMQPQVNPNDMRYDDPILMKSDGLPTYHFANVVDDHLMKITHVVRGLSLIHIFSRVLWVGKKSEYYLNDEPVSELTVKNLMGELNIQLDNLCQFLSQERVEEFARLKSDKLLMETVRSVNVNLLESFKNLKTLQEEQITEAKELELKTSKLRDLNETRDKLVSSVQALEAFKRKKQELDINEKLLPYVKIKDHKRKCAQYKKKYQEARDQLKALITDKEPMRQAQQAIDAEAAEKQDILSLIHI